MHKKKYLINRHTHSKKQNLSYQSIKKNQISLPRFDENILNKFAIDYSKNDRNQKIQKSINSQKNKSLSPDKRTNNLRINRQAQPYHQRISSQVKKERIIHNLKKVQKEGVCRNSGQKILSSKKNQVQKKRIILDNKQNIEHFRAKNNKNCVTKSKEQQQVKMLFQSIQNKLKQNSIIKPIKINSKKSNQKTNVNQNYKQHHSLFDVSNYSHFITELANFSYVNKNCQTSSGQCANFMQGQSLSVQQTPRSDIIARGSVNKQKSLVGINFINSQKSKNNLWSMKNEFEKLQTIQYKNRQALKQYINQKSKTIQIELYSRLKLNTIQSI